MSSAKNCIEGTIKDDILQGSTSIGELIIYQPVNCSQLLMEDNSNCFAVHAYLKMCNLKYQVVECKNAEEMSPTGQIPFVKSGDEIIPGFDNITEFLSKKGVQLLHSIEEKNDAMVYISMINTVLYDAETRLAWFEFWGYCSWRVGCMYPWPLSWYVSSIKRNRITRRQNNLGWRCKPIDQVYEEISGCLSALSDRLGDSKYFFGDQPSELDAVVFGHVFSMLTTPLSAETNKLAETVRAYPKLIQLCQYVDKEFFKGSNGKKIY